MNEECLICKAPLEYLNEDIEMECAICHKKERSKTRCVNGHYICNECHTQGIDSIFGVCLASTSKNPIEILNTMMSLPFCHMHGPEHHIMVGAALLTAYKNAGGDIDLEKSLVEMKNRGQTVPGGACGFWGACGAAISTGMFLSIVTCSTPLTNESFGLANRMTSRALNAIGEVGGPRCCKRDSYLSIVQAVDFVKEHLGVSMELGEIVCGFSRNNNQCIGKALPVLSEKMACDMKTNFYFSGETLPKPANLITLSRIVLSLALLFLSPLSVAFGVLYLLGGVSDMADGFVARKTHTESETGAKLDSAADLIFVTVSAVKLLPLVRLNTWLWIWVAAIALIKIAAMVLRFTRVHTFMPPHSSANKLTGVLLFLLPLTLPLMDIHYPAALVCAVATFAAVQDILSFSTE